MSVIIISESQLDLLREYEGRKVLHDEFEGKLRDYLRELHDNPCHPRYDEFFTSHDIPEDVLQNTMLDLGLIRRKDSISEPEDANGKKRSMHSRQYVFVNDNFNENVDKMYNKFFG